MPLSVVLRDVVEWTIKVHYLRLNDIKRPLIEFIPVLYLGVFMDRNKFNRHVAATAERHDVYTVVENGEAKAVIISWDRYQEMLAVLRHRRPGQSQVKPS